MKKHQKTAAELLAELNSDPAFVTREREREDQRRRDRDLRGGDLGFSIRVRRCAPWIGLLGEE